MSLLPTQADAICRLREEAYAIAKWIDDGYREVLCQQWDGGDSERAALVDIGLPEKGNPLTSDVRLAQRAADRWCQWNGPDTMGNEAEEFNARVRALRDDARKLLRWIESTEVEG